MSEPKFTPEPWCDCASIYSPAIGKSDGKGGLTVIAAIITDYHNNWKADRALLKASPKMYKMLQAIADGITVMLPFCSDDMRLQKKQLLDQIESLLKEARGE